MDAYSKVYNLDSVFGIWKYSDRLRITYVRQGWLVLWDHQQSPPTRYDYQHKDHAQVCESVISKMQNILQGKAEVKRL